MSYYATRQKKSTITHVNDHLVACILTLIALAWISWIWFNWLINQWN